MGKRVAKADLPVKICAVCQRPFVWRKKWRKVWAASHRLWWARISVTNSRAGNAVRCAFWCE